MIKIPSSNVKGTQVCRAPAHRLLHHTASDLFFHVPYSAFPMTSIAIMLKNVTSPKKGVKELILQYL